MPQPASLATPGAVPPAPFDSLAAGYDAEFTQGRVGRAQRQVVWDVLDETLASLGRPASILELNCGTGEDALHLARGGHELLATDVSQAMLDQAHDKLSRAGVGERVQLHHLDLQALADGRVSLPAPGRSFDLVLSNFGGLNCLPPQTLQALAAPLAACLAPGGSLVTVVMPRVCLWETAWALLHGQPRRACRRWRAGPHTARLGEGHPSLPIWYHGPGALQRLLGANFRAVRRRPVGLAVPPSDLEPLARRLPRAFDVMAALDRRWLTAGWAASLADHALIHWRRR